MFEKGLTWNQNQLKIAQLIYQGKTDEEIHELTGSSMNLIWKVRKHIKEGDAPADCSDEAIAKAQPSVPFGKYIPPKKTVPQVPIEEPEPPIEEETTVKDNKPKTKAGAAAKSSVIKPGVEAPLSQMAYLQMVPQVQQIPLSPAIFTSYLCAVKNGFDGPIGDWLSICCIDYWAGRNRDCFAEVSGINLAEDNDNGDEGETAPAEEAEVGNAG